MGGTNPYMESAAVRLPSKPYKLTILPANRVIEVDPAKLPYSRHGAKGSILEIALGNGLEIDHACGGVCACSTCHVYVKNGLSSLSAQKDREEDILDKAFDVRANSRLGCQAKLGSGNVEVEISRESRRAFFDEHPDARG